MRESGSSERRKGSKDKKGNANGLQENLQAVYVPEAGLEPAHF